MKALSIERMSRHAQRVRVGCTVALALALAGAAAGAGAQQPGHSAAVISFPSPQRATPAGGTFQRAITLSLLRPGMSKNQVSALIGVPHFSAGLFGVHQWDYLFHIAKGSGTASAQCQLKVVFDNNMLVRNLYWNQPNCLSGA